MFINSRRITHLILLVLVAATVVPNANGEDCGCSKSIVHKPAIKENFKSNGGSYLPDAVGIPAPGMMGSFNSVTEDQAKALIELFDFVFDDISFRLEWGDPTVNAIAFGNNGRDSAGNLTSPDFGKRTVVLFGGMARHPALGLEGLSIILAHEVGHHYGETQRLDINKTSDSPTYPHGAYCEGQSDFWATRVGMRLVYNYDKRLFKDADYFLGSPFDWQAFDEKEDSEEYQRRIDVGIEQCHAFLSGGLFVDYDSFIVGSQNPSGHDHEDEPVAFNGCGHPQAACRRLLYTAGGTKSLRPSCTTSVSGFSFASFKPTTEASYQKSGASSFGGDKSGEVNQLRKDVAELKVMIRKIEAALGKAK